MSFIFSLSVCVVELPHWWGGRRGRGGGGRGWGWDVLWGATDRTGMGRPGTGDRGDTGAVALDASSDHIIHCTSAPMHMSFFCLSCLFHLSFYCMCVASSKMFCPSFSLCVFCVNPNVSGLYLAIVVNIVVNILEMLHDKVIRKKNTFCRPGIIN